jgi:archaeosine-15-forming tRNA-guanine transglycosylase
LHEARKGQFPSEKLFEKGYFCSPSYRIVCARAAEVERGSRFFAEFILERSEGLRMTKGRLTTLFK